MKLRQGKARQGRTGQDSVTGGGSDSGSSSGGSSVEYGQPPKRSSPQLPSGWTGLVLGVGDLDCGGGS